jgi:glycosyltransferase involved in cell wall biosynthesis
VLEAFREGTPVIGRRLGPYPEILESTGAGLLFDDEGGLRDALLRLIRDRALRDRLGAAGARAFSENWSEELVMDRYFELIREVAGRRGLGEIERAAQPEAARV